MQYNLTNLFREYCIWCAFYKKQAQNLKEGRPVDTFRTGYAFRDEIIKALGGSIASGDRSEFFQALQSVAGDDVVTADYLNAVRKVFIDNVNGRGSDGRQLRKTVPVSPLDPSFRFNSHVMAAMGRQLYFHAEDIFAYPQNGVPQPIENPDPGSLYLYSRNLDVADGYQQFGDTPLDSMLDRSGMTMIQQFVPRDTYEAVRDHVLNGHGSIPRGKVDMVYDFCTMLQREGRRFEFYPDQKPGQLSLRVFGDNDLHYDMRIADTAENADFCGSRVYANGLTYRYTYYKGGKDGIAYAPRSADEMYDLLRFSMQEDVKRRDSSLSVGDPSVRYSRRQVPNTNSVRTVAYNDTYAALGASNQSSARFRYASPSDLGVPVYVLVTSGRASRDMVFYTDEFAEKFVTDSVASARTNFEQSLEVAQLIDAFEKYGPEYKYPYSPDRLTGDLQRAYWSVLCDPSKEVYAPSAVAEGDSENEDVADYDDDTLRDDGEYDLYVASKVPYTGTGPEKIRAHASAMVDMMIGQYERDEHGKRFDVTNVSRYMNQDGRTIENTNNLTAALRKLGIDRDDFKGAPEARAFVADKLVRFNPSFAEPIGEHPDPFIRDMGREIVDTLKRSGCIVDEKSVLIDHQGIVQYKAVRVVGMESKPENNVKFTGEIGQIFEYGNYGLVTTRFGGSKNYLFSPGHDATLAYDVTDPNADVVSRMRLKDYHSMMTSRIRSQIFSDVMGVNARGKGFDDLTVGVPTSLNYCYKHSSGRRFDLDFIDKMQANGYSEDEIAAIMETHGSRFKFPDSYNDLLGRLTEDAAREAAKFDPQYNSLTASMAESYSYSAPSHAGIDLSEGHIGQGIDETLTSTGKNAGVTGYLAEGTRVENGRIVERGDGRASVVDIVSHCEFDPPNRFVMEANNMLTGTAVVKGAHVALVSSPLTHEDAIIVTKRFAEAAVPGHVLRVGDKLDTHGNKGVIGAIIDPDMSEDEAREKGVRGEWMLFSDNPNLDVIMSPYSLTSRQNAGIIREALDNPREDLELPNGETVKGGIIQLNIIVTNKLAEKMTVVYANEGEDVGVEDFADPLTGRKASIQGTFVLDSLGVDQSLIDYMYRGGDSSMSRLREVLITMGLDIDPTGRILPEYTPQRSREYEHGMEDRHVFSDIEPAYISRRTGSGETAKETLVLDVRNSVRAFTREASDRGGFLNLPFPLTYRSGRSLDSESVLGYEGDGYMLPVLPPSMRSDLTLTDGSVKVSDLFKPYLEIYESAVRYKDAESKRQGAISRGDNASVQSYEAAMTEHQAGAQKSFDKLSRELEGLYLEGKSNIFRKGFLGGHLPRSATAVLSPDVSLDIAEASVSREMADRMRLKEGDDVLVFRDPLISDGGMILFKVGKVRDDLTGVALNPAIFASFNADCDGDTMGVCFIPPEIADKVRDDIGCTAKHLINRSSDAPKLLITCSGPLLSGLKKCGEYESYYRPLQEYVYHNADNPDFHEEGAMGNLRSTIRRGYDTIAAQPDALSFENPQAVIDSLVDLMRVKGKPSDIEGVAKRAGFDLERVDDADDGVSYNVTHVHEHTLSTEAENRAASQTASIKALATGLPGALLQQNMARMGALLPGASSTILAFNEQLTQALLDTKHDPKRAKHITEVCLGPMKYVNLDYKLTKAEGPDINPLLRWKPVYAKDPVTGKSAPVRATPDEWANQLRDIVCGTDGLGLSVNPKLIDKLRDLRAEYDRVTENGTKPYNGVTLLTLAYSKKPFEALCDMSVRREGLFDDSFSQKFTPKSARAAMQAEADGVAARGIRPEAGVAAPKARKASFDLGTAPKVPVSPDEFDAFLRNIDASNDGDTPDVS